MSDPIEAAAAQYREGDIAYDPDMDVLHVKQIIAAYERAKVVCDECDGTGRDPRYISDTTELRIIPCSVPGPMLQGPDGPFHADIAKIMWLCIDPRFTPGVRVSGPALNCRQTGGAHRPECGWTAKNPQVWEEA